MVSKTRLLVTIDLLTKGKILILGLNRSDSKDKSRKNGNNTPITVESWLFGLGFQDFVNAFIEFGYDNLDFIVSVFIAQ